MALVIIVLVVAASVAISWVMEKAIGAGNETPDESAQPVEYFYERLRDLGRLRSQGSISEKELRVKRKEVLGL